MASNLRGISNRTSGVTAVVFVGLLTLGAQSPQDQPKGSVAGNAATHEMDSTASSASGLEDSWAVYEKVEGKLIPLEKQPLTLQRGANGRDCIIFTSEKSIVRVSPDVVIIAKGSDVDRYKYPATISRLSILSGGRGVFLKDMARTNLLHTIEGENSVALTSQNGGLAPGEYVVTLKLGEDIVNGDVSFLFGVD
jgi:hypothetical protein